MSRPSLFARFTDNILIGAISITATPSPATSYDEDDLALCRPSKRIRWDVTSPNDVTIRVVPNGSKLVDLVVIPVCNAQDGSIVITSSTGLNEDLGLPVIGPSGMSKTLAVDLRELEQDAAKRTSSAWFDVTFSGMSEALLLGGFLGLYGPARPFIDRDFRWGFSESRRGYQAGSENDHGTEYVATRRTQGRSFQLTALGSEADRDVVDDWLDANFVGGLPAFLWIDPGGRNRPIVGRVDGEPTFNDVVDDAIDITMPFRELGKGKPIA